MGKRAVLCANSSQVKLLWGSNYWEVELQMQEKTTGLVRDGHMGDSMWHTFIEVLTFVTME